MWTYVKVNQIQNADVEFDEDNKEEIFKKFKQWNDKNHKYSDKEIENLDNALDMLISYPGTFTLDAEIDEIELSEDEVDEAYADIHDSEGTYQEGYNAAIEENYNLKKYIKLKYGTLLQKLEHLSYGYGNQEPLTKDEVKIINNILTTELE